MNSERKRAKHKILFVEDEPELLESLKDLFKQSNFKVVVSDEADNAIAKTMNEEFSLMIFDIHLKRGTGDFAIERIRKNNRNPNQKTPIFVCSSNLDSPLILQLRHMIQGAIVKPFLPTDLLSKVSDYLTKFDPK